MCRLYETIKVVDGIAKHLQYHNARLNESRRKLFGMGDEVDLGNLILVPENVQSGLFKCRITYTREIEKIEFEKYLPRNIRSLKLVEANDIDYSLKYADRKRLMDLFEKRGKADDVLIVKNGMITDASIANIVFWDGAGWVTPLHSLLNGTTRSRLIAEGKISVQPIKPSDLNQFVKAKLINAMLDIDDDYNLDILVKNILK